MKVITLWQPYASLIAWGLKRFETRSCRRRLDSHVSFYPLAFFVVK